MQDNTRAIDALETAKSRMEATKNRVEQVVLPGLRRILPDVGGNVKSEVEAAIAECEQLVSELAAGIDEINMAIEELQGEQDPSYP